MKAPDENELHALIDGKLPQGYVVICNRGHAARIASFKCDDIFTSNQMLHDIEAIDALNSPFSEAKSDLRRIAEWGRTVQSSPNRGPARCGPGVRSATGPGHDPGRVD